MKSRRTLQGSSGCPGGPLRSPGLPSVRGPAGVGRAVKPDNPMMEHPVHHRPRSRTMLDKNGHDRTRRKQMSDHLSQNATGVLL